MKRLKASAKLRCVPCLALIVFVMPVRARAQEPIERAGFYGSFPSRINSSTNTSTYTSSAPGIPQATPSTHRFWDRTNDWWFAGVGAARAFDYASRLNIRRRGIDEVFLNNSIVDNHS